MRLVIYSVLRIALVAAAAGVLYLAGLRSWALWTVAIVVAALVSFLLLGRQRQAAAQVLAEHDPLRRRRSRLDARLAADAAYEDEAWDRARAAEPEAPGPADDSR